MSSSFATPWTITHQVPPSMGFPRQGYWSGLPFSSPGDLPDPGIEPSSLVWQMDSLPLIQQGSLIFSLSSTKQYHLLVLNHSFSQQIVVRPLGPSTMLYKMNGNFPSPLTQTIAPTAGLLDEVRWRAGGLLNCSCLGLPSEILILQVRMMLRNLYFYLALVVTSDTG